MLRNRFFHGSPEFEFSTLQSCANFLSDAADLGVARHLQHSHRIHERDHQSPVRLFVYENHYPGVANYGDNSDSELRLPHAIPLLYGVA